MGHSVCKTLVTVTHMNRTFNFYESDTLENGCSRVDTDCQNKTCPVMAEHDCSAPLVAIYKLPLNAQYIYYLPYLTDLATSHNQFK